jgi:prepilin-type N-terminal cleavage/methylation domain-containing protein
MRNVKQTHQPKREQAGVSLLEVLIAVSLLGLCFAALFPSLSAALRTTGHLSQYDHAVEYATNQLNELVLEPALEPGQERSGISPAGFRWRAKTELVAQRPWLPDRPVELMRMVLDVSWKSSAGEQSLRLETLKLRIPRATTKP